MCREHAEGSGGVCLPGERARAGGYAIHLPCLIRKRMERAITQRRAIGIVARGAREEEVSGHFHG